MECTRLGRTGLKVSRLCLGTMNFGPNTGEKEAFAIMDRALEAGINFFDTANMYGMRGTGHRGLTEEIIGRWFAQGGGRREKVVLATKVFADMMDENDGPNGAPGLSAYKIRRHLEGSLRRLGTDHIELYYMHEWDPHCTWTELWEVFGALAARGDIFYVGASNFSAWQLAIAQAEADRRGLLGIVCSEHKFNLMRRLPELELHPLCRRLGIGAATWSPLNMGLLSGALSRPMDKNQRSAKFAGALSEEQLAQQKAYRTLRRTGGHRGGCGHGLAAAKPRRDGADYRAAHRGPAEGCPWRRGAHAAAGLPG